MVWERETGRPVANAVVWQCRRTAALCDAMRARGLEPTVRERTGLPIDAYFSATKVRWLLDNVPYGQSRAEAGELLFGTVDSWLLWNLTNGLTHATDVTNASRTMLFDTGALSWDRGLMDALDVPPCMMPEVKPSCGVFAHAGGNMFGGQSIPIAGVAGDQHAALFGQACFEPGMAKNTYGTGSFVLMNTGASRVRSDNGLITTPAWALGDGVAYALEGSIFSTGATVQWLRDGLGIISDAAETGPLAASVEDNGGVYLVPAFTGLGAPHWDMYARGTIVGVTRGTTAAHLARARPRGDRLPDPRRGGGHDRGRGRGATAAARGRRGRGQRLPHAVPGGRARRAHTAGGGRDHRAGRRIPGWPGSGLLGEPRRD